MDSNTRAAVRQLSAAELKAMIDAREAFEFVDVRTESERAIASIDGARLLDREYGDYLLGLDRSTLLVFHCHHGIRSQAAAEYCIQEGFTRVCNLAGGIDAWSTYVDHTVPRY
jgi:monothiol glutaredoxin